MNLIGRGKSDSARCGRQRLIDANFWSKFERVNQYFSSKQEPCETFKADTLPLFCEKISSRTQNEGWPPLKLPPATDPESASCDSDRSVTIRRGTSSYVKVSLEGVAIGRKIDLNVHDGYDPLLQTLEFMFEKDLESTYCQQGYDAFGTGYTLTYEDRDGDWMLVGDIPWQAFVRFAKRLKIRRIKL